MHFDNSNEEAKKNLVLTFVLNNPALRTKKH